MRRARHPTAPVGPLIETSVILTASGRELDVVAIANGRFSLDGPPLADALRTQSLARTSDRPRSARRNVRLSDPTSQERASAGAGRCTCAEQDEDQIAARSFTRSPSAADVHGTTCRSRLAQAVRPRLCRCLPGSAPAAPVDHGTSTSRRRADPQVPQTAT